MDDVKKTRVWGTPDEKRTISFMGSDEPRGLQSVVPSIAERKRKVAFWLESSSARRWQGPVNVAECQAHARRVLAELKRGKEV